MPQIDLSTYAKKRPNTQSSQTQKTSLADLLSRDISFSGSQLADKKKEAFYSELSTLSSSGIDIRTALEMVGASFEKPADRKLIASINEQVISGSALSEAIKTSEKFTPYEYFSLRIGEETGRSAEVLGELYLYFKRRIAQRRKIISAVTYPIIVLCTSMGAIIFMIKFVVPMFGDVFTRFGGKLPYLTQLIIDISEAFDRYFYLLLAVPILLATAYFIFRKHLVFKKYSSQYLLKIPLIGDIVRKIYLARLANTMRLLVGTDTPLLQSLELVRQMIGFYPVSSSLEQAEKDIMNGQSLSQSLGKSDFYPVKFIQMIRIAEEVNQLEHFFGQLSNHYTEEVEYRTNAIGNLLEPLIIIVLGAVVGIILIAMYLPMFQLSNSF